MNQFKTGPKSWSTDLKERKIKDYMQQTTLLRMAGGYDSI